MDAGVQHRRHRVGDRDSGPGPAGAESVQPDGHRRPHDLLREWLADRHAAAAQRAQRELRRFVGIDRLVQTRTETAREPVHRPARGQCALDHRVRGRHPQARLGLHLDGDTLPRHSGDGVRS